MLKQTEKMECDISKKQPKTRVCGSISNGDFEMLERMAKRLEVSVEKMIHIILKNDARYIRDDFREAETYYRNMAGEELI